MTLSELIILINWEVKKSSNFVEELTKSDNIDKSINSFFDIEKFELEIPLTLEENTIDFAEINKRTEDERFRNLLYPLILQSDKDFKDDKNGGSRNTKGKVLNVEVKNSIKNNLDCKKRLGFMKIILKKTNC